MTRFKTVLLGSAVAAGLAATAFAQTPPAQVPTSAPMHGPKGHMGAPFGNIDPAQLPETKGKVAQYLIGPRGDVDGVLLEDGTEIHLPPHLATALVFAARPGDLVSVRGLKARNAAMVMAVTLTNVATGTTAGGQAEPQARTLTGRIKAVLHSPRGDVDGAVLDDGTILRMPPPEAARLAALIGPGQTVTAQGEGSAGPLGAVVMVRQIGRTPDSLTEVKQPHFAEHHGMHGMPGTMPMKP
jgi:hypothetical protein